MNNHRTDLSIDRLAGAFQTTFDWIVERDRKGEVQDFAGEWVDLLASGLHDVRMTATPAIDAQQPGLPFVEVHRITTETFFVARSGMRGGPAIDVLLQLWFDTEEMVCAYGIPLIFQRIANSGRMPDMMWHDLQEVCRKITMATPCARVVFVAKESDFEWFRDGSRFWDGNAVIATDAHGFAGACLPPAPVSGRRLKAFCQDLASGWIGDPALAGREPSAILDEVMSNFLISHVLRIRVERESKESIYRPAPLPF